MLGAALVSRRSRRNANEGLISLCLNDEQAMGAMVQLSCEKDFVAQTEQFQVMAYDLAQHALELQSDDVEGEMTENEETFYSITTSLGQKIELCRIVSMRVWKASTTHEYIHRPLSGHCGKTVILMELMVVVYLWNLRIDPETKRKTKKENK